MSIDVCVVLYEVIGIMVVVIYFCGVSTGPIVFDEQLSAINLSKHVFPYVRFLYLFPYRRWRLLPSSHQFDPFWWS
jgi:hypothetical protein